MKKKILLGLAVFAGLLILLTPVLYLTLQKTQESKILGPNPTEEYKKFVNDKTITKIYSGVLPCEDCDGIESTVSISKESEAAVGGVFTMSETYLGSTKDSVISNGTWSLQKITNENSQEVIILVFSDGKEKKFERKDPETIVVIDKNGKRLQENGKDLVLTLLN